MLRRPCSIRVMRRTFSNKPTKTCHIGAIFEAASYDGCLNVGRAAEVALMRVQYAYDVVFL